MRIHYGISGCFWHFTPKFKEVVETYELPFCSKINVASVMLTVIGGDTQRLLTGEKQFGLYALSAGGNAKTSDFWCIHKNVSDLYSTPKPIVEQNVCTIFFISWRSHYTCDFLLFLFILSYASLTLLSAHNPKIAFLTAPGLVICSHLRGHSNQFLNRHSNFWFIAGTKNPQILGFCEKYCSSSRLHPNPDLLLLPATKLGQGYVFTRGIPACLAAGLWGWYPSMPCSWSLGVVSQHALQLVSGGGIPACLAAGLWGWYPSMPCRSPGPYPGGVSQHALRQTPPLHHPHHTHTHFLNCGIGCMIIMI